LKQASVDYPLPDRRCLHRREGGDTARQATSPEVKDLRSESLALKECVADLTLENRLLKKSMTGNGGYEE
jgi:transposase